MSSKSFFNPLDRSQIDFIAADRESVTDSEIGILGGLKISGEQYSFRDSFVPSETSQSIFSDAMIRPTTSWSTVDHFDRLSSVSSGSSRGTDMSHGVRYKIVLKLTPREVNLVRSSWAIMLNDELSGDRFRSTIRRLWHDLGSCTWGSSFRTNRQNPPTKVGSSHSVNSHISRGNSSTGTSATSATKSAGAGATAENVSSGAFASSIFCSQFYGNLLYMEPSIEKMFPSIRHQAVAFAGVLTMAVNNLDDLTTLEAYLSSLGKRHSRILSIEPFHFELMGMAFLKTIKERFGYHSTLELEETWSRLYSFLANSILQFGIDPVLKFDVLNNEIIFPVPDLVKGLPTTKSPLWPSAPESSMPKPKVTSVNPNAASIPTPTPTTVSRSKTVKKLPQPRNPDSIPARSLYTSSKSRDSDKDCIIM
ncbi:LAME_0G07030g1_1 [Lachancea meyersii CBS 8951]|uniref:LAME_0G07030g1_1 n=1 Tax=Lachancea meyersii CBS 8951 TaxID=1266667 RepID=A0A1G4K7S5_9SACH|nr:LAME_0G07030g1_1 [Lachancea meyersii CBS 8951]